MIRTYKSKKETGGGLDPRDIIQAIDEKSSIFDGFYIQNLKQAKREFSYMGTSNQFPTSNRVRKKKFVKRLKEPLIQQSTSQSTFLTPDKSLRVNKAPDPFDQLLNSSVSNKTPILKYVNKFNKSYKRRKKLKKKIINVSSSDSSGSNIENEETDRNNWSDINSHNLLIEKEINKPNNLDESINNIERKFINDLRSVSENINSSNRTPQENLTQTKRNSELYNSPLCSTPFLKKYRGKSIYKYSPIFVPFKRSPKFKATRKKSTLEINNSVLESCNIPSSHEDGMCENNVRPNDITIQCGNNSENIGVSNISNIHILLEKDVQQSIHKNDEIQCLAPIEHYKDKSQSSYNCDLNIEHSLTYTDEDEPSKPFIGFSRSSHSYLNNKRKNNLSVFNSKYSNEIEDILIKPLLEISRHDHSCLKSNDTNSQIEHNSECSNDFNCSNNSYYDTCSENESNNSHKSSTKLPVVVLRRINKSLLEKYLCSQESESDVSLNPDKNLSVDKADSNDNSSYESYASFNTNSSYEGDNEVQHKALLHEANVIELENTDETNGIDDEVTFVTTRKKKKIANSFFTYTLENSFSSTSSRENKTIANSSQLLLQPCEQLSEESLCNKNNTTLCDNVVEVTIDDELSESGSKEDGKEPDNDKINNQLVLEEPKDYVSSIYSRHSTNFDENLGHSSITIRRGSRLTNSSICSATNLNTSEIKNPIVLQPGKKWERSLSIYRRMTTMVDGTNQSMLDLEPLEHKGRKYRQSVISAIEMQDSNTSFHNESIKNRRSTFVSQPFRSKIRLLRDSDASRTSICSSTVIEDLQGFLSEDCDDTIVDLSKLSIAESEHEVTIIENFHDTSSRLCSARDYVLRRCNQTDAILFDECYPDTALKNCRKIGEGVSGEVYLWRAGDGRARVLKVIPIAGDTKVNGEKQKDYAQIISEIVIAMELSARRAPIPDIERHFNEGKSIETLDLHSIENATDVFNEVLAVRLVHGAYPSRLLDLWDLYDECKGSENDNPAVLPRRQHYLVLELANAGQDLESFQFNNAEQAYALFKQVAFGLAVAEEACQFEHRDLHWGNVLISPTDLKFATFVLRGRTYRVRTCGVKATIIDYSLSRVSLGGACGAGGAYLPYGAGGEGGALYAELGDDESLFDAVGDYQFDVYRLMRDRLGNVWENFDPYTNILWLHYTADKMITALRYTRTNTKIHKHYIAKLKEVKNKVLDYGSSIQYVLTDDI